MDSLRDNFRLIAFLGFSALLFSVFLVWVQFPQVFYAGLDGSLYQFIISTFFKHTKPFSVNAINIFQGLGSPLIPMNVWLNPGYLVFSVFSPDVAKLVSAVIFLCAYCFSTFLLARTLGVSTVAAIISGQLAVIAFPPFQYELGVGIQLVLNPGVTYPIALLTIILCLVLRISACSFTTVITNACAITALYAYSIYCDPLWTAVISIAFVIPFLICLFADGARAAFCARVLSLMIAVLLLYFLGIFNYVLSLTNFTARQYFQAEVFGEEQTGQFVSMLFQSRKSGLTFWLLFSGWILGLVFATGKQRLFALMCAVYMLSILGLGFIYLFLDINWNFPIPLYFEQSVYHLYIVGATVGWASLLRYYGALILRWPFLKARPNWTATSASFSAVIGVLIVPVFILHYLFSIAPIRQGLYQEKPPIDTGFVQYLRQEVGLVQGKPFHGSVATPLQPPSMAVAGRYTVLAYERQRMWLTLWNNRIPTLEIYGQMVPPPYYYFASRLLIGSNESFGRNGVHATVLNLPVLQVLGMRFIVFDGNINSADATLRKTNPGEGITWHLYELANPNVGNYAPSRIHVSSAAPESIEIMGSPGFNFTSEAVVTEKIGVPLGPTRNAGFSYQNGDIHVWGESDGYSLMVLPVQFSRCLKFSGQEKSEIKRVNLTLTGILFHKKINSTIRMNYGFFSPKCRLQDLRDLKVLKFAPDDTRTLPSQHPHTLVKIKDLKRQLIEVLGELLP